MVALTPFKDAAADVADVMLPIAPFTETAGTFVNAEGRAQSFHGVVKPLGETRPAWKVLRVLGNLLGLAGFDHETADDVRAEALGDLAALAVAPGQPGCGAGAVGRPPPAAACSASPTCRSTPSTCSCAAPRRCSSPPTRASRSSACRRRCGASWAWRPGGKVLVTQGRGAVVLPAREDAVAGRRRRAHRRRSPGHRRARRDVRRRRRREGLSAMFDSLHQIGNATLGPTAWLVLWSLVKIVAVVLPLMICVAYLTLWERKGIGYTQIRLGPNRVGPAGLLQPIADAVKLIFKEIIRPTAANKGLFFLGPVMTIMPALAAWAVVPFGPETVLADVNAGLLFLMAVTSLEVYGVIIAGWASNSKYAFLGALRASAQMVSYEIAMGFCLVVVLMVSATMNMTEIVMLQGKGMFADRGAGVLSWNWLPLLPIFVVFFIAGLAETNRHPFDVVEGESEIVAGHMIEYSGMSFAMFFLAEYANMILVSTLTVLLFLGGWLPPFGFLDFIPGWIWLAIKVFVVVTMFLWVRATFPRFRYDQIMRLGWKIFIPVTLVWLVVVGLWIQSPFNIWK